MIQRTTNHYIRIHPSAYLIALATAFWAPAPVSADGSWPMSGQNVQNTRYLSDATINKTNVVGLTPKWTATLCGSVWSTPAVQDNLLYVTDTAGYFYKIVLDQSESNQKGEAVYDSGPWSPGGSCKNPGGPPPYPSNSGKPGLYLADLTGVTAQPYVSTVTPAIADVSSCPAGTPGKKAGSDILILGDRSSTTPNIFAVSLDGTLVWKTPIVAGRGNQGGGPSVVPSVAKIVQSPIVYQSEQASYVFVGVASGEEGRAQKGGGNFPGYDCCRFRGSMLALDPCRGGVSFSFDTISPPPPGVEPSHWFSGAAVLGSTAVVVSNNLFPEALIFTTGNNYNAPPDYKKCIAKCVKKSPPSNCHQKCNSGLPFSNDNPLNRPDDPSVPPYNYANSIIALDFSNDYFNVLGYYQATPYDAWNGQCIQEGIPDTNPGNCPNPRGSDQDFIQGPMVLNSNLIGAADKSGRFFAIDTSPNGNLNKPAYTVDLGVGGIEGGSMFGSATDGYQAYVAIANSELQPVAIQKNKGTACPAACKTPAALAAKPTKKCAMTCDYGTRGFWSALSVSTGDVVWQTFEPEKAFNTSPDNRKILSLLGTPANPAAPNPELPGAIKGTPPPNPFASGSPTNLPSSSTDPFQGPHSALTLAGDVLWAGTMTEGLATGPDTKYGGATMFALDSQSGEILWSYPDAFESSVVTKAGPAVIDGTVYWGTSRAPSQQGQSGISLIPGSAKLYAFAVPAKQ